MKALIWLGGLSIAAVLLIGYPASAQQPIRELPPLGNMINNVIEYCYKGRVVVFVYHSGFLDLDANGKPVPCRSK
jgi:hypothetical protein